MRQKFWNQLLMIDEREVRIMNDKNGDERVDWLLKGGSEKTRVVILKAIVKLLVDREKDRGGLMSSRVRRQKMKKRLKEKGDEVRRLATEDATKLIERMMERRKKDMID